MINRPHLKESLKLLFTNKRFIYLLISTCFVVGYYNIYSTILNAYFGLYGIDGTQATYSYVLGSGIGIISSLAVSA